MESAISKQRKGKCEGRLLKVVTPADYEKAEGACPHRADCGGCTYQTVPYEEQLKIKERQVRALLDPVLRKVTILRDQGKSADKSVSEQDGVFLRR